MKVVVTLPAYNEEKNIGIVLTRIHAVMRGLKYKYHVLVVDDGSKDKTVEIATKNGAKVISHPVNFGLAETFNTEMKESLKLNPDIIVHIDADKQYNPEDIPKLIKEVKEGYGLVLGSRFRGHIESMSFIKKWGNMAFSRIISKISRQKITDAQTGFRAFTKELAGIKITSNYTYTQEQIIRASKAKFKIKEVPIFFGKRGGNTKSRLMKNPFDFAIKAWINLIRLYRDYEPLKFFGLAGGLLLSIGIIIGLWVVYLFLTRGVIGRTPSIILSMLLIVVGVQIMIFGLFADMNRK